MNNTKVKQMMSGDVKCLKPTCTLMEAAKMMEVDGIGAIPIVDNNKIVGMVTDRDIVIKGLACEFGSDECVSKVMSKNIQTISEEAPVGEALSKMAKFQVRRLPVVNDKMEISGMLSLGDLSSSGETNDRAGIALTKITEPDSDEKSNRDYGVEIGDFPL